MSSFVGSSTVRAIQPDLIRYFTRHTPSRPVAQDLAQETWRALAGYKGTGPVRAYLFRVAFCLLADWHRDHRRRQRQRSRLEGLADAGMLALSQTSLGTQLQKRQEMESLLKAVDELSEPFRETLLLVLQGHKSHAIAERQGISVSTVRSRLTRARERLRRKLLGG